MGTFVKFPPSMADILGVAIVAIVAIAVAKNIPGVKSFV